MRKKGKGPPLNFDHANLKMLSPKQMLRKLPIALAQLQADNP